MKFRKKLTEIDAKRERAKNRKPMSPKNQCKHTMTIANKDGAVTLRCDKPVDTALEKKFPHKSHISNLMRGDYKVQVLWHIPEVHV